MTLAKKSQKMHINTTQNIRSGYLSEAEYQRFLQETKQKLGEFPLVPFSIPVQLQSKVGSEMPIGINGVQVVIPADGKTYEIPEPFAKQGYKSLQAIEAADLGRYQE